MAPLHGHSSTFVGYLDIIDKPTYINNKSYKPSEDKNKGQFRIIWRNVIFFIILHLIFLYGLYLILFKNKWQLFLIAHAFGLIFGQGITAGAHRLWAHRSYKVKLPLKVFLILMQTASFQNSIYEWVRDHRAHHKYTDTDADPHNAKKGFFFSHMGWLMVSKHRDVKERGKSIDMSDITSDPIIMWQHRNYIPLMLINCFLLPPLLAYHLLDESFWHCFIIVAIFRYIYSLHSTWLVNSAAHIYGMKPYDKSIGPAENKFVAIASCGEGFHNYHHVFPWDYKTSELGSYSFNITLAFINFCAKLGLAFDMKTVSADLIKKRANRTGDGSWLNCNPINNKSPSDNLDKHGDVWGWGDSDMSQDDINSANILYKNES